MDGFIPQLRPTPSWLPLAQYDSFLPPDIYLNIDVHQPINLTYSVV